MEAGAERSSSEAGVDKPDFAKPAQRSSYTGPAGYIDGHSYSLFRLAGLYGDLAEPG